MRNPGSKQRGAPTEPSSATAILRRTRHQAICVGAVTVIGAAFLTANPFPAAAVASPLNLTTQANLTVTATGEAGDLGSAIADAGDFNGDGIDDVVVGADYASFNGQGSGSAFVLFGSDTPAQVNVGTLTPEQGIRIDGVPGDYFSSVGFTAAGVGDVNGDGLDDVAIGRYVGATGYGGDVFVVLGTENPTDLVVDDLGSSGFILAGTQNGFGSPQVGAAVSSAGDINGDGLDDILLGAPGFSPNYYNYSVGQAFVVFGTETPQDILLNSLGSAGITISAPAPATSLPRGPKTAVGSGVAAVGDINGDQFDDFAIGASGSAYSGENSGSTYIVFGSATPTNFTVGSSLGSNGVRIDGQASYDRSGSAVGTVGDVDNDGTDDLIIGAPYASAPSTQSGAAYVVSGTAATTNLVLSDAMTGIGFKISGADPNAHLGAAAAGVGDINQDSFADVIVGARNASPNGTASGSAYVIYGSGQPNPVSVDALTDSTGFQMNGGQAQAKAGTSVGGGADFNNDGVPDALVGAPGGVLGSGRGFVVYGDSLPVAPAAPSGTGGDLDATLTWTPPAQPGSSAVSSYEVQVGTSASGPWTEPNGACADAALAGAGPITTCIAAGLTADTDYYFRIRAINDVGAGPYSDASAAIRTNAAPPGPTPPGPTPAAQVPLNSCVRAPKRVPKTGSRLVERANCTTNAGTPIKVTATLLKQRRGDVTPFRIVHRNGRAHLKTKNFRGALKLKWTAPAVPGFRTYTYTRTYKV